MKKIAVILVLIWVLFGCAPRFVIPDEPVYKGFSIIQLPDGVCMENPDFVIFQGNIDMLWNYARELRTLLEEIQSGGKAIDVDSDKVIAEK